MLAWPISRIVLATAVVALCAPATRAQNYNPYVTVDVIEDIPALPKPPPAHKVQPGPPDTNSSPLKLTPGPNNVAASPKAPQAKFLTTPLWGVSATTRRR